MRVLNWGLAVFGWIALAATALPAGHALRVTAVALFLIVCPGLAFVTLIARGVRPPRSGPYALVEAAVLGVVLSLAMSLLVTEALCLGDRLTSTRALIVLATLTSGLALPSLIRRRG
ncbi:hypothetical protein ACQEWB_43300 [Streptomyces sp. CA-249302]|uniref:hypothetical protein n=1 Tax=Streptomyces sp. CA-249302 TaxID=3240058 RepID=UPI003D8A986A